VSRGESSLEVSKGVLEVTENEQVLLARREAGGVEYVDYM